MPDTATSPYFLAGLGAVLCFFLTGALVGFSLFTAANARLRLLQALASLLTVMVLVLAWLSHDLLGSLEGEGGLLATPEPGAEALAGWTRETLSVLLFALSTVFTSLLAAFAWVRAGAAGAAFRAVPWAVVAVKVVLAAAAMMALLGRAALAPEAPDAIPAGALAATAEPLLTATRDSLMLWGGIALGLTLLSWPVGWMLGRVKPGEGTTPPAADEA